MRRRTRPPAVSKINFSAIFKSLFNVIDGVNKNDVWRVAILMHVLGARKMMSLVSALNVRTINSGVLSLASMDVASVIRLGRICYCFVHVISFH